MNEISIESTSGYVVQFYTRPCFRGVQIRIVNADGFPECWWNLYPEFNGGLDAPVRTRQDLHRNLSRRGFTKDERSSVDRLWFAHLDGWKA